MDALNKQKKLICMTILAGGLIASTALILCGLHIPAVILMGIFMISDIYYYVKTVKAPWTIKNTFSLILVLLISVIPFSLIAANGNIRGGISLITGIVLFFAFFLINTPLESKFIYKLLTKSNIWHVSPSNKSYNTYRRHCAEEWYRTHPSGISNLSVWKITQRVIFSMTFIFVGIYGIYTNKISIFQNDRFFDIILCFVIILFAFYYYLFGFRHCAFIAFIAWYLLIGVYFLYKIILSLLPEIDQNIFCPAMGSLFVASALLWALKYAEQKIMYSNVQSYEKNGNMITLDLFLATLGNIAALDLSLDIAILPNGDEHPEKFVRFIKKLMPAVRSSRSVFCGYTTNCTDEKTHIYIYTSKNKSSRLIKKACSAIYDNYYELAEITASYDESWTFYKKELYPNVKELCSITSRNYIERLFLNGIALDREYDVKFLIYCKDSDHVTTIKDELMYFGFNFYRITYEQERNKVYTGYDYCAEFKISTFITPRRLEYLNSIILNKTEGDNALFMGEWLLSAH